MMDSLRLKILLMSEHSERLIRIEEELMKITSDDFNKQIIESDKKIKEILTDRVCKNCKWWSECLTSGNIPAGKCSNIEVNNNILSHGDCITPEFYSEEDFGCNQWEPK